MPEPVQPWPFEKIGRVAKVVDLVQLRMVEYHAIGFDLDDLDPENYHTRWDVGAFGPSGVVGKDTDAADLAGGFDVMIFFDYHDTRSNPEESEEPEANDRGPEDEDVFGAHLWAAFFAPVSRP